MKRFILIVLFLSFLPTLLVAARIGGWNRYESDTGLFSFEAPGSMEKTTEAMRASRRYEALREEFVSVIDRRDYNNSLKTYSVIAEQTWGPRFSRKELMNMHEKDLEMEIAQLSEGKANLINAEFNDQEGYADIIYSYQDPELGEQGAHSRFYYTDVTKLEMKISGPLAFINNKKSLRFFDSLYLKRNYKRNDSLYENWVNLDSPQNIFSVPRPPQINTYFPHEPTIKQEGQRDQVSMVFYEPVRKQSLYYKIYGYAFDRHINRAVAQRIMAQHHLAKYNTITPDIRFKPLKIGEDGAFEYRTSIDKTYEKAPYLDRLILRSRFNGNLLVVQEIVGSEVLIQSVLVRDLLNLMKFPSSTNAAGETGEPADFEDEGSDIGELSTESYDDIIPLQKVYSED